LFVGHDQIERIIADPRIAAVTLTGSDRAGRSVAQTAGKNLKKAVLELGGSDPFIVASSADMDLTIPLAVTARVQNNGQACIASKRYIVVKDRADEFIEKFVAAMEAVPTGDPMDPATVLGPVVSKGQLDELAAQVSDAVAKGAVVRTGGKPLDGEGFYFPATVLTNVPVDSRAGCEELFGPVAVVQVVNDLDEAIEFANATPWGLGGAIYATDQVEIAAAIAGLDVGMVFANSIVASMPELPFGGTKESGFGRELGEFGVREFTNVKSFYVA
jgi:succinate-semialdehyde dehydrogenase/glutarate-semialdehyde dehydrogenase